jgi:virginiamycin A acetyltransferase
MEHPDLEISPDAVISQDARIFPSSRGTRIVIGANTQIFEFVVIRAVGGEGDIVIGEYCYVNSHCILYSGNGIHMGNNVLVAPGTAIMPVNHSTSHRELPIRSQGFAPSRGGVFIEDDVWIGANCVLLDGAYVERGAVVAAGSVVKGRVSAYSVWAGSPAKYVKMRP